MIHVHIPDAPDFTFLVVFAVILVGPLVIRRFKVPGIIGMLIGGLLIGPHVFGFLGSGETTIPNLGNFGLLYLMFMAGLELDLKLVMATDATRCCTQRSPLPCRWDSGCWSLGPWGSVGWPRCCSARCWPPTP